MKVPGKTRQPVTLFTDHWPGCGQCNTLPGDEGKEKQQPQKLFLFRSEQAPVAQTEIDSNT